MLALKFLIIAMMISGLFLHRRVTLSITAINLGIVAAFFFIPDAPFTATYAYLVFFLVVAALGAVSASLSRRYKQQLAESEALYRSLVAALSEGIVLLTSDGAIRACNAAAERILGLTADQMIGRATIDPRWRTIHEDGSPFPGEEYPAMVTLRTGEPLAGVVMGIHQPDGELRWISINTQPLMRPDEALPYAVVASFSDITQRKRAEEALRQSEQRYREIVNTQTELICRYLPDSTLVFVNNAYCRYFGKSREELLGRSFLTLIPEDQREAARQHVLSLLEKPRLKEHEFTVVGANGQIRWQAWVDRALVNDVGEAVEIQAVGRDITEQKEAQQRKFALALEKERVRLLSSFIQNAAHEFRTPLAVIGTTAYLVASLEDPKQRQDRVNLINEQIRQMAKLLDMLLLMTRLNNQFGTEKSIRIWQSRVLISNQRQGDTRQQS